MDIGELVKKAKEIGHDHVPEPKLEDTNALDLEELLEHDLSEHDLGSILDLVAQASWWVNPSVYQSIQIVYPKTRPRFRVYENLCLRGLIVSGRKKDGL